MDEIEFLQKCLLQPKFEPLVLRFFMDMFFVFFNTYIISMHLRPFLGAEIFKYTYPCKLTPS